MGKAEMYDLWMKKEVKAMEKAEMYDLWMKKEKERIDRREKGKWIRAYPVDASLEELRKIGFKVVAIMGYNSKFTPSGRGYSIYLQKGKKACCIPPNDRRLAERAIENAKDEIREEINAYRRKKRFSNLDPVIINREASILEERLCDAAILNEYFKQVEAKATYRIRDADCQKTLTLEEFLALPEKLENYFTI